VSGLLRQEAIAIIQLYTALQCGKRPLSGPALGINELIFTAHPLRLNGKGQVSVLATRTWAGIAEADIKAANNYCHPA